MYHVAAEEKLIAYSSYLNDNNKTEFFIHSIKLPLITNISNKQKTNLPINRLVLISILIVSITCFFFYLKTRTRTKTKNQFVSKQEKIIRNYQIIFFGGFQVFDKNKQDITNKFSPLLKELFLLLWLHTFYKNKGLSSTRMTPNTTSYSPSVNKLPPIKWMPCAPSIRSSSTPLLRPTL